MLLTPPDACLRVRKVGENTDARPDSILIINSLERFTIQVAISAIDIDWIIFVDLHSRIDNAHRVEAHRSEFSQQPLWIGETVGVPGEDPVAIQRIDVQIQGITGNITLAKGARDRPYFVRRLITEAALSIAQ